jgi:carboxypeptidase Q
MRAPYYAPLIAHPLAWTPGTNGEVKAQVMVVNSTGKDAVSKAGASVKGKVVLFADSYSDLGMPFKPTAERFADTSLKKLGDTYMVDPKDMDLMAGYFADRRKSLEMLTANGAVAVLFNGHGRDGTIYVDGYDYKKGSQLKLPQLVLSAEDFLRMQRLVEGGTKVEVEMDLRTKLNLDDTRASNVVAEIEGTDPSLKAEVVMLGGHLDSWHSGTGATDNASGCIAALEAVRILKTLGVRPRRTIRIVLWGGEEQGLLGSYHYTLNHFGDPATMKLLPEQQKISAYYNLDNGSGRIRGIFLQHNDAAGPIFRDWFAAYGDSAAQAITRANTGETDHFTLDALGIPGFQFIQDPLEYETRTHHSNMDVYDHLLIPDLHQAATIMAVFVYNTAMRDQMMPRKPLPAPGKWLFADF